MAIHPSLLRGRQNILLEYVKLIKKDLPKSCTFLAPVRKTNNNLYLRATIKSADGTKDNYLYSLPEDLDLTDADLNRVKNLILEKCQPKN